MDWTGWITARGGLARGDDGRSGDKLGTGVFEETGKGGRGVGVEEEGEEEDGDCSRSGIWRAHWLVAGHNGGWNDVMKLNKYL